MRMLMPVLAAATLAGCTTQPPSPARQAAAAERDARFDAEERRALAGLTAGEPVSCISTVPSRSSQTIGERTILYRAGGNLIYRNDPPGGCAGLSRSGTAIVTRTPTTQLCRGEIVRVIDTATGMDMGGCSLGDFVPYRRGEG